MAGASNIRRIGLYGPFGWGNLGDASIQEAMMHNVRLRLPHVEFRGISLNPENTEEIHGIAAFPIERTWLPSARQARGDVPAARRRARRLRGVVQELRFIGRAIRFLRSIDIFILSGGGQLSDDWGGPWAHPYSILKWTVCARLAGCRVYVVSVGAGPFIRRATPVLLRTAMRLAHYRSYRDQRSHDLVSLWGFTRRDPIYPDLAFSLPLEWRPAPEPGAAVAARAMPGSSATPGTAAERPLVLGISPMSYCYPRIGAWPEIDARRYERYRRTLLEFTLDVLEQGHSVLLLSSELGCDYHAFDDLVHGLRSAGRVADGERLRIVPTRDLPHLLEQISAVDILVTSRLHGVILAYLHHKPAIALSYDPKIQAVMEQCGQAAYCLGIEQATTEQLRTRLQTLQGELSAARARIGRDADENRARLEEQYDRLFGPRRQANTELQVPVASLTGSHST